MSRIGKKPIALAKGVKLERQGDSIVVSGPKGTLSTQISPLIKTDISGEVITLTRSSDSKREKSLHGLYAVLLKNMIHGVTEGFSKKLELVGIGYRAEIKGGNLYLSLGFSHPVIFIPPEGIKIDTPTDTTILVSGIDKQLVGQVAAKIRSLKEPEPYKGKGIRYEGEFIRRKAGKAAAK
ncbi:MAG: 50S ribosomal protein L6 [Ignavibacteria bacterium]|nr:50S ribosomal protein L6 [Ignavibacteria bacterium]